MKYENKVWFFLHFLMIESIIEYAFYVINVFMKKVIKQLWQLIFKHKKKLIYGALAFFVAQICFFDFGGVWIENEVYALDSDTPTQNAKFQEEATKWYEEISFFQQSLYVILYPLLVVAWKLVDNSFVYWEVFGFDAVLWQLWNIVKNLANFGLWFLLIYKIFEYLIKWEKQVDIKKIILSALIAWVWIQASWFIMAALIDVSTVLTYGIWWLPISILKENSGDTTDENLKYNPYMMKMAIYFDLPNSLLYEYVTNAQTGNKQSWEFYISKCEMFSYKDSGVSETLILAPEMIYYLDDKRNVIQTVSDKCHLWPQDVYYFSSLYVPFPSCSDYESCRDAQIEYKAGLDKAKSEIIEHKSKSEVQGLIESAQILQQWDAHSAVEWPLWSVIYSDGQHYWKDVDNKWTWEWWNTSRLQDVLSDNSYVWVFTALYSSLLSMWKWLIPTDAWIFPALLNAALSLWHVLAVWIPLIAVALVFMMRVGVLWMAVALLPFVILLKAFDLEKSVFKDKPLEYLKIENLIPIIFAPAIICFAVSISTVLVTIVSWLNLQSVAPVQQEILWWLIKLNVWGLTAGFWRFITSVLCIAIVWFLMWAAIEATKLWKSKIITSLKDLATTTLWSMPIVPVPWRDAQWNLTMKMAWTNAVFGDSWIFSSITNKFKQEFSDNDNKIVRDFVTPDSESSSVKWRMDDAYKQAIIATTPASTNWTEQEIIVKSEDWKSSEKYRFIDVYKTRKTDIINAINGISDETKRDAFGKSQPKITFNDWEKNVTYEFNGTSKKYELKNK